MSEIPEQAFGTEWTLYGDIIDTPGTTCGFCLDYWNDNDTRMNFSLGTCDASALTGIAWHIRAGVNTCDWCRPIFTSSATIQVRGLPGKDEAEFHLDAEGFYGTGYMMKAALLGLADQLEAYAQAIEEDA